MIKNFNFFLFIKVILSTMYLGASNIDGIITTAKIIERKSLLFQDKMISSIAVESLNIAAKEGNHKLFQKLFELNVICNPEGILKIILKAQNFKDESKIKSYQSIIDLLLHRFPLRSFFSENDIRYLYFLKFFRLLNSNQRYLLERYLE